MTATRSHALRPTRIRVDDPVRTSHWQDDAACREPDIPPELFFPAGTTAEQAEPAKAVCGSCPVRQCCLEWALTLPLTHGVAGGLDERERATLRRHRRAETISDPWGVGFADQWSAS